MSVVLKPKRHDTLLRELDILGRGWFRPRPLKYQTTPWRVFHGLLNLLNINLEVKNAIRYLNHCCCFNPPLY